MSRNRVAAALVAVLLVVTTMQMTSGWVGVVTTRGVSMEPTFTEGDLVVTRRTGDHSVGDIIAYRSEQLSEEVVLHRIIDIDADRYITQGDNNDWVDTDRPTSDDVVGEVWFQLPGAGRFVAPLRRLGPLVAVGAFLLLSLAFTSRSRSADTPRRRTTMPTTLRSHLLANNATAWLAAAGAVSALLAVAGFRQSTSVLEQAARPVEHTGQFSYQSPVDRSIVYPDGSIDAGDPVFRSATDAVTVTYEHEVRAPDGVTVDGGTLGGDVLVRVGAWEHRLARLDAVELVDGRATLDADIVIGEVDSVVREYRSISGQDATQAVVLVQPSVRTMLKTGAPTSTTPDFDTSLELSVGPDEIGIVQDQLEITGSESVDVPTWRARDVDILGRTLKVRHARLVAITGVVGSTSLLFAALAIRRRASAGAPIVAAAGSRLVAVAPLAEGNAVDVLDGRAFQRIAAGTDGVILHSIDEDGTETFLVDDGRARYRYAIKAPEQVA